VGGELALADAGAAGRAGVVVLQGAADAHAGSGCGVVWGGGRRGVGGRVGWGGARWEGETGGVRWVSVRGGRGS
jgi:hypothetical protein